MKYLGLRILICIAFILSCYPSSVVAWDWNLFKKEKQVDKKEEVYILGDTIPEMVIEEMIAKVASGTKAYQMERTIYCESGLKNIQSMVINKQGEQEESYGISQIHLPSHPTISLDQTLDPEFSIQFMNDNWDKVKWYGYNRKLDKCN